MKKAILIIIFFLTGLQVHASVLLDFNHANARLYGSSEAFLVEENDLNNLEVFPASLAQIKDYEVSTAYVSWLEMVSIYKISLAKKLSASDTLALSFNMADLKNINNYDASGNLLGSLNSDNDISINLGYAYLITRNLQAGANLRYIRMKVNDTDSDWLGTGFSMIFSSHIPAIKVLKKENINLGAGIQNLNIKQAKFVSQDSAYPVHLNTGVTYDFFSIKNINFSFGSSLDYVIKYQEIYNSIGLEVNWQEFIYLRTGYYLAGHEFDQMNFGLGIIRNISKYNTIKFDYANSLLNEGGKTTYLQFSLTF